MAVQLKASPTVYDLAHHRSKYTSYWTEAHASVNRGFNRVILNSNWGSGTDDVDAYMSSCPRGSEARTKARRDLSSAAACYEEHHVPH